MLRLEHVSRHFGGIKAVDEVSLNLGECGITGLVGPNGSGKTTLFHLITGFYKLDTGRVFFCDKPIHRLKPHRIGRLGLMRTFQQNRVLPFLSVLDNLLAAAPCQAGERLIPLFLRPGQVRSQESEARLMADEVMTTLKLSHLAKQPAGRLSYGQQKLLELGRVLMGRPRLVLLDEPTAGINPTLIRRIVDIMFELRDRGIRFFLVEHNMPLVSELCERLLVMDAGRIIFDGSPKAAVRDPVVIEAYLGKVGYAA